MNQPVAITDDTAKELLVGWQVVLSRNDIEAHINEIPRYTQLLVPASKLIQARKILFNKP